MGYMLLADIKDFENIGWVNLCFVSFVYNDYDFVFLNMYFQILISRVENPYVVRNILVKLEASIKLFKGNTGNGNCGQWSNVHF